MQKVVKRDEASLSPERRFRRSCTLGLSFTCCLAVMLSSTPAPAGGAGPEISVSPEDAVVFGSKALNSRHRRSLVIKNVGTAPSSRGSTDKRE